MSHRAETSVSATGCMWWRPRARSRRRKMCAGCGGGRRLRIQNPRKADCKHARNLRACPISSKAPHHACVYATYAERERVALLARRRIVPLHIGWMAASVRRSLSVSYSPSASFSLSDLVLHVSPFHQARTIVQLFILYTRGIWSINDGRGARSLERR